MRKTNFAAAFLALWTMSVAPLAQGKEAEAQANSRAHEILESLGFIGPDKAKNMGEVWARARETLPPETLKKYDRAVSLFRDDPVPHVSIQNVEGRGVTDATKLTLTLGADTITLELPADMNSGLKINGIAFTKDEILGNENSAQDKLISIPYFRNAGLKKKDQLLKASIVPTREQFMAMTRLDWARYQLRLGELLAASEDVVNAFATEKTASLNNQERIYANELFRVLFGNQAFATVQLSGECVVAGWISKYVVTDVKDDKGNTKKVSLCSRNSIEQNLKGAALEGYKKDVAICKQSNSTTGPCASFFRASDGGPVCVTAGRSEDTVHATKTCYETVNKDREAALKGLLISNGIKGIFDANGKVSPDKLKDVQALIDSIQGPIDRALKACGRTPRERGQQTACEALNTTKTLFTSESFAQGVLTQGEVVEPAPVLTVTAADGKTTEVSKGGVAQAPNKTSTPPQSENLCMGLIKSDLVCGGLLGATGGAFIGGLIGYGLGQKAGKKKKNTVVKEVVKEVPGPTKTITVDRPGPTVYVPGETKIEYRDKEVIKYLPAPEKRPTEYSPSATK